MNEINNKIVQGKVTDGRKTNETVIPLTMKRNLTEADKNSIRKLFSNPKGSNIRI